MTGRRAADGAGERTVTGWAGSQQCEKTTMERRSGHPMTEWAGGGATVRKYQEADGGLISVVACRYLSHVMPNNLLLTIMDLKPFIFSLKEPDAVAARLVSFDERPSWEVLATKIAELFSISLNNVSVNKKVILTLVQRLLILYYLLVY